MPLDNLSPGDIMMFKNDKQNDRQPDYRGEFKTPNGEHLRFSLWLKESASGSKFMSGQVQELYQPGAEQPAAAATPEQAKPAEDDIPF